MIFRCATLFALVFLAGCLAEEVHTVEYYTNNSTERAERLKSCEQQHNAHTNANCVNAGKAQSLAMNAETRKFWEKNLERPNTSANQ